MRQASAASKRRYFGRAFIHLSLSSLDDSSRGFAGFGGVKINYTMPIILSDFLLAP
ncbi:MAG: hypothetical protein H6974_16335 [Gammaproteobacteria bacterium]|nr:hypothetical protein [Gammaproteobacteria bacterium]MCP5198324.1 hypothetical protein [Gammaproteobacteria bacterium]